MEALIAAYNEGEEWLEELKSYLFANYQYLKNYFNEHLPDFPVLKLEGTYLVWVDCSVLKKPSEEIMTALTWKKKRSGSMKAVCYGEDGDNFIRINTACPRQQLAKGLERLKHAFGQLS